MLNKIIITWAAGLMILLCTPVFGYSDDGKGFTLLFTGNLQEKIKSRMHCGGQTAGGLLRRATMVEILRQQDQPYLVIDCGNMFHNKRPDSRTRAEFTYEGLSLMGYDAVNLGDPEFLFGVDYVETVAERFSFDLISANILYKGQTPDWIKKYIIREKGGIKVAVTGVASVDGLALAEFDESWQLDAIDPATALTPLIPEMRKQADLVILMSQLGVRPTINLVKQLNGIDLVICCRQDKTEINKFFKQAKGFITIQADFKGEDLGYIRVSLDENGKMVLEEGKQIMLGDDLPMHNQLAHIHSDLFSGIIEAKKKRQQQMHADLLEGLDLSPDQFMQQLSNKPEKGDIQ